MNSRAISRYVVDALSTNKTLYPKDLKKRALVDKHLDYDIAVLYKHVISATVSHTLYVEVTHYNNVLHACHGVSNHLLLSLSEGSSLHTKGQW